MLGPDGADDPAHGAQEGAAYHGYYRQRMSLPPPIFDGETGPIVADVLKWLVRALRGRWPKAAIAVRAGSGFARPEVSAFGEAEDVTCGGGRSRSAAGSGN